MDTDSSWITHKPPAGKADPYPFATVNFCNVTEKVPGPSTMKTWLELLPLTVAKRAPGPTMVTGSETVIADVRLIVRGVAKNVGSKLIESAPLMALASNTPCRS